jgi:hypothetical protein
MPLFQIIAATSSLQRRWMICDHGGHSNDDDGAPTVGKWVLMISTRTVMGQLLALFFGI